MTNIREIMHNSAGHPSDLARYSDDDVKRLLDLPHVFAAKCPDEPFNDCPFDDVTRKYFYYFEIENEAKQRGITLQRPAAGAA